MYAGAASAASIYIPVSFLFRIRRGEGERELLFRHIYRMLELGGEDCIAWGTDLDGQITCDPSLGSPFGAASFGTYLAERGFPKGL